MKQQQQGNSLAPMIVEAERVIAKAVKHFGLNVKPENIIVTIQSKGKRSSLGWFWNGRWQNGSEEKIHEINLSAEHLKRDGLAVGETLIHELAHAENDHNGVEDCSGKIHNKHFKSMAERLGLKVQPRNKSVGFGYTELDEGATKFLEKIAFKREVFQVQRVVEVRGKVGSRLIKAECEDCGCVIRITRKWINDAGLPTCACGGEFQAE